MKSYLLLLYKLITYNVKVIFANKFVYFVLAAFLFFTFIITITILEVPDNKQLNPQDRMIRNEAKQLLESAIDSLDIKYKMV